jgi:hypothetical protein
VPSAMFTSVINALILTVPVPLQSPTQVERLDVGVNVIGGIASTRARGDGRLPRSSPIASLPTSGSENGSYGSA